MFEFEAPNFDENVKVEYDGFADPFSILLDLMLIYEVLSISKIEMWIKIENDLIIICLR